MDTPTTDTASSDGTGMDGHGRQYLRFGAMILTSTVVMFALTYTNVFQLDHARWSQERVYMALLMGAAMALVMLGFMWSAMYRDVRANALVIGVAIIVGVGALWASRAQVLVDDDAYMGGMIPHHSIAILTSERANIDDVRVRELADGIIKAQRKEIKEMSWLINDIEANGAATTQEQAEQRPIPDFEGQLDPEN